MSSLKAKSIRGGLATAGSQVATLVVQIIATVILSRVLAPNAFGLMAIATAVTAIARVFQESGLSSATIQADAILPQQLNALFWLNVLCGTIVTVVTVLAAPTVALFFHDAGLVTLLYVLSLSYLLNSIGSQHTALLIRDMRYGVLAIIQISVALITAVVSIAAAIQQPDATALAFGAVAGAGWSSALLWLVSDWHPGWPSRREAKIGNLVGFGAHVTGFNIVNYFHRRLDDVLIGLVWGAQQLGCYNRAYSLLMMPIVNLRAPLNSVAIPAMTRLVAEPERYRNYFCKYCQILAFATMPPIAIAATCSDALMRVVLGPGWSAAGDIFLYLAAGGLIQPVAGLRGLILLSAGASGKYFRWGFANAIATCASFCIGVPWGACGVAAAYSACAYLLLHPSLVYACDGSSIRPADFYRAVFPPFIAATAAALTFAWLRPWLGLTSDTAVITAAAFIGGSCFLGYTALFPAGRDFFREARGIVQQSLSKTRWAG